MKTDKEMAVELTIAYLSGGNIKSTVAGNAEIEAVDVLKKFKKALSDMEES